MQGLRTGKRPASEDTRDFLALDFVDRAKLPAAPPEFGHERVHSAHGWGMLGNDEYGDCYWAGSAHETMIFTKSGSGRAAPFTTHGVLSDYASTGFDPGAGPPGQNPTDGGTDCRQGAGYRRSRGIVDAHGKRHRIGAYLRLPHDDPEELAVVASVFEASGIGILFPESAMTQFDAGDPWEVVAGTPTPTDGHYVPYVARRALPIVVTWGRLQAVTTDFLGTYVDEAWAYVSPETLSAGGTTPEGLNVDALNSALASLRA